LADRNAEDLGSDNLGFCKKKAETTDGDKTKNGMNSRRRKGIIVDKILNRSKEAVEEG